MLFPSLHAAIPTVTLFLSHHGRKKAAKRQTSHPDTQHPAGNEEHVLFMCFLQVRRPFPTAGFTGLKLVSKPVTRRGVGLPRLAHTDQFTPSHAEGGYLHQGGLLPARMEGMAVATTVFTTR